MATSIGSGDIHLMAVGLMYINLQKSAISFPTTNRARPSRYVVIYPSAGDLIRDGDQHYFPFKVLWNVWHQVMLPVLRDPRYQFRDPRTGQEVPLNMALLRLRDYDSIVQMYEGALTEKFQQEGFIPTTEDQVSQVQSDPEGDGEPIVDRGTETVGDPDFPLIDSEDYWPEGHLRLEYPTVD